MIVVFFLQKFVSKVKHMLYKNTFIIKNKTNSFLQRAKTVATILFKHITISENIEGMLSFEKNIWHYL